MTPFVDGELAEADRLPVEAHVGACPSCRRAVERERIGRQVLSDRAEALRGAAPAALRAAVRRRAPASRRAFRLAWVAASAAAMLVAAVALIAIAEVVRPVPVFAAQATLDHLKCVRLGPSANSSDPAALEASWRGWQGWPLVVPSGRDSGMTLLGYRRCVITEGRLAHLLYRRNGETLSLFVMPDGPHVDHTELEMFGQDAVLWESHGLTYALVGRGDRAAMAAVAASLEREVNARAASTMPAVPER
jgi:anti-sigma factor RsiW